MYLSDEGQSLDQWSRDVDSMFSVEYSTSQYADILEEMRIKNETMQDEIQESY